MQPIIYTKQVTIANGASLSGAAFLENLELVAVVTPAAWTTAALTFQASFDNVTYVNVWNGGAELAYAAIAASTWVTFDPALFLSMPYIKVRSGTGASAVNQAGGDIVTLVMKPLI